MKRASDVPPLGVQFRPAAGHLIDRGDGEFGEGPGFGHEHVGFDGSHTIRALMRLPQAFVSALLDQPRSVSWVW